MLANYPTRPTLPTRDLEQAKRFYGDTLGLEVIHDSADGVTYRSGNTQFFLFPSGGSASGAHTQMGWQVPDVEAEVAELRSRGVVFEEYDTPYLKTVNGIATPGPVKAAWFKDPDGNLLGLVQYLDASLAWQV